VKREREQAFSSLDIVAKQRDEAIRGCERVEAERESARQGEDELKAEHEEFKQRLQERLGEQFERLVEPWGAADREMLKVTLSHALAAVTAASTNSSSGGQEQ
jgi:hypothetical protein